MMIHPECSTVPLLKCGVHVQQLLFLLSCAETHLSS